MTTSGRPAEQRADIDGSGNVVVQILGNDNRVDLGRPYLKLTRYLRRRIDSDADLLSPYARSIPLVGRGQKMAELRAWLGSGREVAVRVLTGRAGAGKTRLALELCEEALAEGWAAGFVKSEELRRFQDRQNLADWGWDRPTLIVIDYAAEHAERLGRWLGELADNPGDPERPLRLLLLERHAEAGTGWWQTAFGRGGFGAGAVQKLLDPAAPVALPPLAATDERRAVIGETLAQAASDQRPPAAGSNPAFDRQLAELSWGGEPLFLMMAGLVATEAGMGNVLSLRRTDLAFELADRELARIARLAKANGVDSDFLKVMAGHATLRYGFSAGGIRAAVPAEQAALGLPGAGDPGKVAKVLAEAVPGPDGGAAPILPDMIGEAALLRSFAEYDDRGSEAVCRAFASAGRQVAATVIRTAQDFATGRDDRPLLWLNAVFEASCDDTDMLFSLAGQIPSSSMILLGVATQIYRQIETNLRNDLDRTGRPIDLIALTVALNNLSNKLIGEGKYEAAISAAEELVQARRLLFEHSRDQTAFFPHLASAFITLAHTLYMRGWYDRALIPINEAIRILESLERSRDEFFCSECAQAFGMRGNILSHLNRHIEATRDARSALSIYRFLHIQHSNNSKYRLHFAVALTNLAGRYLDLRKIRKSYVLSRKAVAVIEALAINEPDSCLHHWALCLLNLANSLNGLGRYSEASKYAKEGVRKYQAAVKKVPRLKGEFAFALATLANCEDRSGNGEGALSANHEAINVFSSLFFRDPAVYLRHMKSMVDQYQRRCAKLRRQPDWRLLSPILNVMRQTIREGR